MVEWQLTSDDLKHYPHFDRPLRIKEAEGIACDPARVTANAFFPFLSYEQVWQPFRPNNKSKKIRPIRYAARRDAYIFSRYRHILSEKYESALATLEIEGCPIAYRKIPIGKDSTRGKCNIHFAHDAFNAVFALRNCAAVVLDISSYFDSIDHELLRKNWCRLIEKPSLPPDHEAVYAAITKYSVVDRDKAYERLGYFGERIRGGRAVKGFLRNYDNMPTQLCSPKDFRLKIAGGDLSLPSLIKKNPHPYGIPQGAPISDVLANIYLLDFDIIMADWVHAQGGKYFRYSDDILVIVPGGEHEGKAARDRTSDLIRNFGDKILIKPSKTSIVRFEECWTGELEFHFVEADRRKAGLEYLGFRFDGKSVYLRNATLSNFYRKMTYSLRHEATALVGRYIGKDVSFLERSFDLERFMQKFGRVGDFDANTDYQEWTFWTYVRRAAKIFGPRGAPMLHQIKNHRSFIQSRLRTELETALQRRGAS